MVGVFAVVEGLRFFESPSLSALCLSGYPFHIEVFNPTNRAAFFQ
jgi:hypothetical protein